MRDDDFDLILIFSGLICTILLLLGTGLIGYSLGQDAATVNVQQITEKYSILIQEPRSSDFWLRVYVEKSRECRV